MCTYSFEYLYDDVPIDQIEFTSKLECYNQDLQLKWLLNETNIETLHPFKFNDKSYIAAGTTPGNLLILEGTSGSIVVEHPYGSCTNSIQYNGEKHILCFCNDIGEIHALLIEND